MKLKVDEGLPELAQKAKATYDYYNGTRTNKLGNLQPATAAEIKSSRDAYKIATAFNRANANYTVQVDRTDRKLLFQFNATATPKGLVKDFDKGGAYAKYVNNYNPSSKQVDLIIDAPNLPDEKEYQKDITTKGGTNAAVGAHAYGTGKKSESVMTPTPTPYKLKNHQVDRNGKRISKKEDKDEMNESFLKLKISEEIKPNQVIDGDSDGDMRLVKSDLGYVIVDPEDNYLAAVDATTDQDAKNKFQNGQFESKKVETKKNSFKDHHICQGCNKPLSQCTCEVEDEDKVNESLNENKHIEYDDDIVVVYENGEEIYRGMEDYEPMKDEPWKWNNEEQAYLLTGPNNKQYKKVCIESLSDSKSVNESDNVQYGVRQFSTGSIIFRGTEEECGTYIDKHKELWDDAEVYRMEPGDPYYKNESLNESSRWMSNSEMSDEINSIDPDHNEVLLDDKESTEMYRLGYILGTSSSGEFIKASKKDYAQYVKGKDVNGDDIVRDDSGEVKKVFRRDSQKDESLNEAITTETTKTIKIELKDPDSQLESLIRCIKGFSDPGHTFAVIVDPDSPDSNTFSIDGDGSFRITNIEVKDEVSDVEVEEECLATQPSSIGQHKTDSIDIIPEEEKDDTDSK